MKKMIICLIIFLAIIIAIINIPYYRYRGFVNYEYIEAFELREDIVKMQNGNVIEVMKDCKYDVVKEGCNNYLIIPPSRCKFVIENKDIVSSVFEVEIYLRFRDNSELIKRYNLYIASGERKDIKLEVSKRLKGYRYYVKPPQKKAEESLDLSKGNPIIMCKTSGHNDNVKEYCLVRKKRVFNDLRKEKYTLGKKIIEIVDKVRN